MSTITTLERLCLEVKQENKKELWTKTRIAKHFAPIQLPKLKQRLFSIRKHEALKVVTMHLKIRFKQS